MTTLTPTGSPPPPERDDEALAPARDRPRERLRARGAHALADAELLALVLGSGVACRSALRTARALARRPVGELAAWPFARWLAVVRTGATLDGARDRLGRGARAGRRPAARA